MNLSRYFCFRPVYFVLALLLVGVEAFIAAKVHDAWIRPYGGDFLVVILIYCMARSFIQAGVIRTAAAALIVSYAVETGQYFHLIVRLGLQNSRAAQLVLGYGFSWIDMLMYTLGVLMLLLIESLRRRTIFSTPLRPPPPPSDPARPNRR